MVLGNLKLSQEVPEDEALELTNGIWVRSVLELLEALKAADEETFTHHVSEHYNDFAEWIIENYHDDELCKKVLHSNTKTKLIKLLESELKKELKEFSKEQKNKEKKQNITPPKRKKDILKRLQE